MWQLIVKFRVTGDHVTYYSTKFEAEEALGRAMKRAAFTGLQMQIKPVSHTIWGLNND